MFDVISMMDEERVDFQRVIFYQCKQQYSDCDFEYTDIHVMKYPQEDSFQFKYSVRFSKKLETELQKYYPEAMI